MHACRVHTPLKDGKKVPNPRNLGRSRLESLLDENLGKHTEIFTVPSVKDTFFHYGVVRFNLSLIMGSALIIYGRIVQNESSNWTL